MFDRILDLLKNKTTDILQIYFSQQEKKGNGVLLIIEDGNKADVRYYTPNKIPFEKIKEEYNKKINELKNVKGKIEVKNKWIINLPKIPIDLKKEQTLGVINIILDDLENQILFQGFPQSVIFNFKNENGDIEECDGVQYILVADASNKIKLKDFWTVSGSTAGHRYLNKCLEASKKYERFLTFRIDSDYTRINAKGQKEEGEAILKKISKNLDIMQKIEDFRENDKFGEPETHKFVKNGCFSIDTLRHINTLYELMEEFGDSTSMKNWKIIEFGGGYGGLAHILSKKIKWKNYYFLEIKEVLELSKKYFMNCKNIKNIELLSSSSDLSKSLSSRKYDLFISEYAFGQLNKDGIEKYLFLLKNSKNAFIKSNIADPHRKKWIKDKLEKIFKNVKIIPYFFSKVYDDFTFICSENEFIKTS